MKQLGIVCEMNTEQTEIYSTEYIPYSVLPNDISDQRWQEREYATVPRYRINEKTNKVEQVQKITLLSKCKKIVWIDYETSILSTCLGICPKCGEMYSLKLFAEEVKKYIQEQQK